MKKWWGVGTEHMMVHRGYEDLSSVLVLSLSERTEDAKIIPCESNGILSVDLYVSNPNT